MQIIWYELAASMINCKEESLPSFISIDISVDYGHNSSTVLNFLVELYSVKFLTLFQFVLQNIVNKGIIITTTVF